MSDLSSSNIFFSRSLVGPGLLVRYRYSRTRRSSFIHATANLASALSVGNQRGAIMRTLGKFGATLAVVGAIAASSTVPAAAWYGYHHRHYHHHRYYGYHHRYYHHRYYAYYPRHHHHHHYGWYRY
jgi:hypothetical protein